ALLFFVMDIHHVMIGMLHASFQKWQIGAVLPTGATAWVSMQLAQTHQWGMQIAAPVALCMLVNLILMVVIMKAAPQLNLFSVGFTLRLIVGLVASLAFLPEMIAMTGRLFGGASEFVAFY
ncbi:MAG: flagellar biosynthetic protein FliR, partial [bacterium]|nr:flagellar biosynthetic protein FliR [bacterium]